MKKMDAADLQSISGGGFWSGFCSGFALGSVGLAMAGIALGPVGAAAYSSVMAGCAINTVVNKAFHR